MNIEPMPSWDQTVDVVIIGSGFAGLSAAIESAQAGCSVIVLEKRDFYGGNSWISGGALAAIAPEAKERCGIIDSTQLMYDDIMEAGRGINDPELVRLVCSQSYSTLQWLRQDIGAGFMDRIDQLEGHSVPRCYSVLEIQGRNIIKLMVRYAEKLGVDIRLNTQASRIYQNQGKEITGVTLCSIDKNSVTVQARKGVVLASGGFTGETFETEENRTGIPISRTSLPDSTGEGLKLAEELGAQFVDMEHVQLLPCASPDEAGRGIAPVFVSYVIFPYGFIVNPDTGCRFVNEWTDRKTLTDAMLMLTKPAIGITDGNGLQNVGEMIYEHMDDSVIHCFDSLPELAEYYSIPPASLKSTCDTYNQIVEQKHDFEFGKPVPAEAKLLQAPFYALRLQPKTHSTMGGVRINSRAEVQNNQGLSIPGLYAAGEVCGGIHGASRLPACAITECLVFGRIAGQEIALQS